MNTKETIDYLCRGYKTYLVLAAKGGIYPDDLTPAQWFTRNVHPQERKMPPSFPKEKLITCRKEFFKYCLKLKKEAKK